MKNLLAQVTTRIEAFTDIKALFEKHPNLTRICLSYYIEEDDSQLMIRICKLQIADQLWEMDDDLFAEEEDNNGFNEYDFSEITNSEILSNDDLVLLQESLQLLLMDTEETEVEDINIFREEILKTNVGFIL